MKLPLLASIFLLMTPSIVTAHEYWIAPTAPVVAVGAPIDFDLCIGHRFPRCETFDFPDTFSGVVVTDPNGKVHPVELQSADSGGKVTGRWTAAEPGRHVITMQLILNHPRRGDIPLYTARAEVQVEGESARQEAPTIGRGLEISLLEDSGAPEGTHRPTLQTFHDGEPFQTSLQVHPAQGRKYTLTTDRNGRAEIRQANRGAYLVYASAQGTSASLYFVLP